MVEFKVGDRVHLRNYDKGVGNGTITDISQEHTENWIWYTALYVEYDEPLQFGPSYENRFVLRGRHVASQLELL